MEVVNTNEAQVIKDKRIKKAKKSKKETQRAVDALIAYRVKHGVKDAKGTRVYLDKNAGKTKSGKLALLEMQETTHQILLKKQEVTVAPLEVMMADLDTKNLSVEELMLEKHNLRNERIKALNRGVY